MYTWVAIDYTFAWVSVCCAVPILGFLEPLVEARCSTAKEPKVSSWHEQPSQIKAKQQQPLPAARDSNFK